MKCPALHVLIEAGKKGILTEVFFKQMKFEFTGKEPGHCRFPASHRAHDREIEMWFHWECCIINGIKSQEVKKRLVRLFFFVVQPHLLLLVATAPIGFSRHREDLYHILQVLLLINLLFEF